MPAAKPIPGEETIGVVPLYSEKTTEPLVPPYLVYNGGPLLTSVEVFTVFWGSAWQSSHKNLSQKINQFFETILVSSLIDELGEYGASGQKIAKGKCIGTKTILTPQPGNPTTDNSIRAFLKKKIQQKVIPRPTPNILYFIYLPPDITVEMGRQTSCQAFCGYHNATSQNIFYAVMPYPNCHGCLGKLSVFDALTSTSTHELSESITDPIPGKGWYDNQNGEIGDICAWKTKKIGNYTVQLEWSNKKKACM